MQQGTSYTYPVLAIGVAAVSCAAILIREADAPALVIAAYRLGLAAVPTGALALAADWLRKGRSQAEQRRLGERMASCFGIGFAALAAAGGQAPQMKRRKFLRVGLRTAALVALTPGVGLSVLSEGFRPDEIHAFDAAVAGLAQLERITDRTLPS